MDSGYGTPVWRYTIGVPPENPPVLQTETKAPTQIDIPSPASGGPAIVKPFVFLVIVAALAVLAYWYFAPQPNATLFGSTTLVVHTEEGGRTVVDLSLDTGVQTEWPAADQLAFRSPSREFVTESGSLIVLDSSGVILKDPTGNTASKLLIASAVPPSEFTPLAVWGGGAKIAWRSPADKSLQVFARNERGVYLPIFLDTTIRANSIAFSNTGEALAVGTIHADQSTDIAVVDLKQGAVRTVAQLEGFARVIQK